nr:hypothetical protein [Candidatus Sigynarchaeota archaeon]
MSPAMMKRIDSVVSISTCLGLFLLISMIFIFHLDAKFIVYTLVPLIATVLVWKGLFMALGPKATRSEGMKVLCMEQDD